MLTIIKADQDKEFPTRERCHILELLNQADHPEFSVARCRVEPGVTTELHSLRDTKEVYIVLAGSGLMDDGEAEGRRIGPLDCVTIPADHPQRVTNTGGDDLIFLAICSERFQPDCYTAHEEPETQLQRTSGD